MEIYKNLNFKSIFKIIMILFSIFIFFITVGIVLNSSVNLKYEMASVEDIAYVCLYSKILLVYVVLVIVFLIFSFKK
jgi:hypothetical protein